MYKLEIENIYLQMHVALKFNLKNLIIKYTNYNLIF